MSEPTPSSLRLHSPPSLNLIARRQLLISLERLEVAIVLLDHLHRRAHIDGEGIDIDPSIKKRKRCIGMAKAVGSALIAKDIMGNTGVFQ